MTAFNIIEVNSGLLKSWPLPEDSPDAGKEDRGHVLVVAGSHEMPGAAMLAATAALRAGAGKLTIATAKSVALALATNFPEARVIALPETDAGGFAKEGIRLLEKCVVQASATLIGPGMIDAEGSIAFVSSLLGFLADQPVVLDAAGMELLASGATLRGKVLITPHAGEMAHLTGLAVEDIQRSAAATAFSFGEDRNVIVALKGSLTCIASASAATVWQHHAELPGLGTSGSGDVLAGIIAGVAARGANLEQAAVWGVAIHAQAGRLLGRKGPGFLARELVDRIPGAVGSAASESRGVLRAH